MIIINKVKNKQNKKINKKPLRRIFKMKKSIRVILVIVVTLVILSGCAIGRKQVETEITRDETGKIVLSRYEEKSVSYGHVGHENIINWSKADKNARTHAVATPETTPSKMSFLEMKGLSREEIEKRLVYLHYYKN